MTDSTHTTHRSPRTRLALLAAAVLLIYGSSAAAARADGDPASDILTTQPLYLPQDTTVTGEQHAQLSALLSAAQRAGYQLRIAIIASPADLGSVTELWRQPQNYARFLGQELALVYHGPLLVIMPNGYGQYHLPTQTALSSLRTPGPELANATLTAIQRLAAASGHNLPLSTVTASPTPDSNDTISWIVFALGGTLILIAWTASLRARPPEPEGKTTALRLTRPSVPLEVDDAEIHRSPSPE